VPSASPGVARPAASVSPGSSPTTSDQVLSDADVAGLQNRVEQAVATPDLRGIEPLLLDHVSLSPPQCGSALDTPQAASWLRDHAGPGIKVSQVTRGTQEVMVQVLTEGWPQKDPVQAGQITFSLRRYDANGRQDESGGGEWKIDVIQAE